MASNLSWQRPNVRFVFSLVTLLLLAGGAQALEISNKRFSRGQAEELTVRHLAEVITFGATTQREQAVRIHDYVRDEIAFGWTSEFHRMSPLDVLEARVGYCNTKGTLFIALLRAVGIRARQHFVDMSSDVLWGLAETDGKFVDHSFAEVYLDGRWLKVDSYVVDQPLFKRAQRKLENAGRQLGFGIHREGNIEWDGTEDNFVQFVNDGSVPGFSRRDYGVFKGPADFYGSARDADRQHLRHVLRSAQIATGRAELLRSSITL
ncbi:MAG: transglutaminase-like domain-containing protein [Pseudomonadota bacterium]